MCFWILYQKNKSHYFTAKFGPQKAIQESLISWSQHCGVLIPCSWIPDSMFQKWLDSLSQKLNFGFQGPGFRIPRSKNGWIPYSKNWIPYYKGWIPDSKFLDSGFHGAESDWIPYSKNWIPYSKGWIPDSKVLDSRFHKQKFFGFLIRDNSFMITLR